MFTFFPPATLCRNSDIFSCRGVYLSNLDMPEQLVCLSVLSVSTFDHVSMPIVEEGLKENRQI